jgi:hypothetical protein
MKRFVRRCINKSGGSILRCVSLVAYVARGVPVVGIETYYLSYIYKVLASLTYKRCVYKKRHHMVGYIRFVVKELNKLRQYYKIGWNFYSKLLNKYYGGHDIDCPFVQYKSPQWLFSFIPVSFAYQDDDIYGGDEAEEHEYERDVSDTLDDDLNFKLEPVNPNYMACAVMIHTLVVNAFLESYMFYESEPDFCRVRAECSERATLYEENYRRLRTYKYATVGDHYAGDEVEETIGFEASENDNFAAYVRRKRGIFKRSTWQILAKMNTMISGAVIFQYYNGILIFLLRNVVILSVVENIEGYHINYHGIHDILYDVFSYSNPFNIYDRSLYGYVTFACFYIWFIYGIVFRGIPLILSRKIQAIVKVNAWLLIEIEFVAIAWLLQDRCETTDTFLQIPVWYRAKQYPLPAEVSNTLYCIGDDIDTFIKGCIEYCRAVLAGPLGDLLIIVEEHKYKTDLLYGFVTVFLLFVLGAWVYLILAAIIAPFANIFAGFVSHQVSPVYECRQGYSTPATICYYLEPKNNILRSILKKHKLVRFEQMFGSVSSKDTLEGTDMLLLYSKRALVVIKPRRVGSLKWIAEGYLRLKYRIVFGSHIVDDADEGVRQGRRDVFLEIIYRIELGEEENNVI